MGTALNLVCTVTVDRKLVDTDITVIIEYVNLPLDITRVTTVHTMQLNDSFFHGLVNFSVLLPSDDNSTYGCVYSVLPLDNDFVFPATTNHGDTYLMELTGKLLL